MALSGEHHIVWFEISVNDALARRDKRFALVRRSIATIPWERSKAERREKDFKGKNNKIKPRRA